MTRFDKAQEMVDSVMHVEQGVYAVPSQTRNAKAHIVRSVPIDLCISVPNSFAVEAEELMAMAQGPTKMFRTALLLKALLRERKP